MESPSSLRRCALVSDLLGIEVVDLKQVQQIAIQPAEPFLSDRLLVEEHHPKLCTWLVASRNLKCGTLVIKTWVPSQFGVWASVFVRSRLADRRKVGEPLGRNLPVRKELLAEVATR
jgi:hypothetical protein